jgi:hypothetical protein
MKIALPAPTSDIGVDNWGYVLPAVLEDVEVFIIGSGTYGRPFHDATVVSSLDEVHPELPLVVLQPKDGEYVQGEIDLYAYSHPEDCVYYFGDDNTHTRVEEFGSRTPDLVYIDARLGTPLFAAVAFWTVAYDRELERG